MNDLSNMPLVTPLLDTQWVPDGSGELPSPWETAPLSYGHQTASGAVYDESRQPARPHLRGTSHAAGGVSPT